MFTSFDSGDPVVHARASSDVAGVMVFVECGNAIGIIEIAIWDKGKSERGKKSMEALVEDSIIGSVVSKQIFDLLFKGKDLVDGSTISEVSANQYKQKFSHARIEHITLVGDQMITSKKIKFDHVLGFFIQFPKDVVNLEARFTIKHLMLTIVIRIDVSMVDEHDGDPELSEVIIVIMFEMGRTNFVVPRAMVLEAT
jgi:hypothetical protein